jgi:hypothetical protein
MVHMHTLGGLWEQVCEIGLLVDETFLLYKPKLTVLRLLCSSAGLSGFLDYLMME